ncbi:MAG: benzoate-CoA ligase family protein [Calditrichaeota bacterium]|nr:MAG: benzoate-CoA ligase family protein [Calditrichota bacterium]
MFDIPERMNAADYFVDRHLREGRGDKVAVVDVGQGTEYTYRQVFEQVNRFGNALKHRLDVRMEERVMLLLLDSVAFVAGFFGSIKTGAVPIPTNTLLQTDDYRYLLNDSRARVLVVSAALLPRISAILGQAPYLHHLVVDGDAELEDIPSQIRPHRLAELLGEQSGTLEPEMMSKDDPCFWLYSSGTTGFPKGTVHLHHDMLVCLHTFGRHVLGIKDDDRTFSVAKLFFAYGLGNALFYPFGVGATTILYPDKPVPEKVFEIISKHKPTIFYSVPTSYAALLNVAGAEKRFDTSSLRLCVSAGEALPPALYQRWKTRFGVDIIDGIGSTEALHMFISNFPGEVVAGASGKVVPGYEAKIVDENGQPVAVGEVGDLLIKGDSICAYYWNKHEATKSTIEGHWIRTGDKYKMDENGVFYYQGRSDDMLKVSGMWVSPIEVENTLMEHEAVLECGVIGAEDDAGLVKPKAFVVLKPGKKGSPALTEELIRFVKSRISPHKYPRWIVYVDSLPKTATGKTQRFKLRNLK